MRESLTFQHRSESKPVVYRSNPTRQPPARPEPWVRSSCAASYPRFSNNQAWKAYWKCCDLSLVEHAAKARATIANHRESSDAFDACGPDTALDNPQAARCLSPALRAQRYLQSDRVSVGYFPGCDWQRTPRTLCHHTCPCQHTSLLHKN